MKKTQSIQTLGLGLMILGAALTGCKKHVAAAPPVTPTPPAPPAAAAPTITLRAEPGTINRGQATTLRWDARNATNVKIEPGLGDVSGNGTRSISPTSSVTYMATATGPGGTASDSARITVNIPAPPVATETRRTPDVSIDQLFQENVKSIYFDYDKSDIRPDQMSTLQSNATWLKQHPEVRFTVEGHCDERGSEEYNLALGDRRANAVKQFLVDQGIPESRMTTISYGEDRPVCHEETEDCYQRNRFAGFVPKPTS
jgi:peptidoglycan-associated lipoprotein